MDKKPKVALVGAGKWGKKLLSELSVLADIKTIVVKGNEENLSFLRESYSNIKSTSNIDDALLDPEIQSVFVATPTSTHYEISKKIISHGKNLFLEKPGGSSSKELEEINKLAKEKGVILAIGYEFAHHKALEKIKEITKTEKIISVDMEWFKWGTFNDPIPAHLLSHEVSILKILFTEEIKPTKILEKGFISESDISYSEFLAGNTKINSVINRVSTENRKTVTIKTEKEILIWNNNDLFKISEDKKLEKINISADSSIRCEIVDFISSVEKRCQPKISGDFGTEVYKIIETLKKIND